MTMACPQHPAIGRTATFAAVLVSAALLQRTPPHLADAMISHHLGRTEGCEIAERTLQDRVTVTHRTGRPYAPGAYLMVDAGRAVTAVPVMGDPADQQALLAFYREHGVPLPETVEFLDAPAGLEAVPRASGGYELRSA